ncbi:MULTISPECIES: Rid family hydrolase [Bradyrhizobium]|uniref:Rid family hydrolase n=1 Tax=Bradyrhizobium centrosematis TaxID=1300039 RepID=UPI002167F164|nr:Rid family hydrolase [Bradyrhizobium centrosematis]MCS3765511.1 enamine deaminase RidA (YjgF/YER057c/UK114 family) [Bradyrhizobium centrosematis]MCS3778045.1 enamine deaminase RidA (YjgF/YER057c/UK114 family) [Bradyrhizobium centrosematis]
MTVDTRARRNRQNISSGGAYENIFGYSRAVAKRGQIHVSGTCAPAGFEARCAYDQAIGAFKIISLALGAAGAELSDVVRTVVYVRNIADADEVARAHLEIFDAIRPASTLVQVTSMLREWQLVEIEAYALIE